ncbi:MAG: tetratricopeptide repeat protein [Lentimicrobiaceae bacterium]|nr:tetratricopeptide repeat protein [Lentimicrobiaceae bacterium]
MKKLLFIMLLCCPIFIFGQKNSQNKDVIGKFMQLSAQELYDTAAHYYRTFSYDTALMCYNLLTKTVPQNGDVEKLTKIMISYFRLATIYGTFSDYRLSQDYYIKALLVCEKINQIDYESAIYMNMGSIYHYLNQNEIAKQYYKKSYSICEDSASLILLLNNLGATELVSGNVDSALHHINLAMEISKRHQDAYLYSLLNNLASCYQHENKYDSAFYYYREALHHSRANKVVKSEAINLGALGQLFFEVKKIDSALHYINLSNKLASKNNFLNILADNYRTLSKIEKSKGNYRSALDFHENYMALKDSINNAEVYESVNHLQRQYEVSKTNQQIEELVLDAQIKENKLYYTRIIMGIIFAALLTLGGVLYLVLVQNKRLKKSYQVLVSKNIEIMALDEELHQIKKPEDHILETPKLKTLKSKTQYFISATEMNVEEVEKDASCSLSDEEQNELLKRILDEMDNTSIICNPDFSINKLADNLNSNQKYISFVINRALNKNFRSFLNTYRIKEAQRLFMELDFEKFTVNSVAQNVGFKSYSGFYYAFKEITGVSPNFYFNSVQEKAAFYIA